MTAMHQIITMSIRRIFDQIYVDFVARQTQWNLSMAIAAIVRIETALDEVTANSSSLHKTVPGSPSNHKKANIELS